MAQVKTWFYVLLDQVWKVEEGHAVKSSNKEAGDGQGNCP